MIGMGLKAGENREIFKKILVKGFLITAVSYAATFIIAPVLLEKHYSLIHTIVELLCIYIALSSFFIIWNSYKETVETYHLIGFGFLAVAVFDCFHTYYWIAAGTTTPEYRDLTTKYWMIGRLAEALVLAAVSMKLGKYRLNKWKGLLFVLGGSAGLSLLLLLFPGLLPVMLGKSGLTPVKILLEYAVIALAVFSLYKLKDELDNENGISYKYIFMSLLFIIPAELSFTLYTEVNGFYNLYGHILKIICYYNLYRAVYVSSVEYPYKRLAEAYEKLEEKNTRIKEISDILNDTLDALPIGIMNYEADRKIKYMNKRLEEILACDRNKLYGLTAEEFLEVFPTADNEEKSIFELTSLSKKNSVSTIRTYKTLQNEYVKLSLTSQNINNGIIVYFYEVKKEQEIKNFHLQTQTVLNAVNNCVLMTDQNKKIVLCNEAFKKIFETNEIDLIGMSLDSFYESIGLKVKELQESTQDEEFDKPHEVSITTLKGNKRELLAYIDHIRNIEEEIIGAISVFTDITELNKQKHSMQQQEKLALIGQMAAGIIHEIKNPLSTIKGLSQLIAARSDVDKIKEYSAVINVSIDDVTKVVNEFLSFAKPKPIVKARTDINRIVRAMQLITETQCYTKNIRIQFHYSSCTMEITADEIKIKQVILNITENAIAAMEDVEQPELIVSTYYDTDSGEGVIRISDNGTGMGAEVLAKLGTPFFTTKEKGTGL
ncbi:MAG TPA: MASE3 domain-containing protein, partial [Clostridia bacterium]|nr:MASE3 domain-containing protein [Clostridia bacterium]